MFEISKDLADLAKRVVDKYPELALLRDTNCKVAYQYSDKEKTSNGKTVYADTTKISDKMKAIAPYDFLVTFYKPSVQGIGEKKMEILMRHELKHIGFDPATGKCKIIPHDIEDFEVIIKDCGMNWIL